MPEPLTLVPAAGWPSRIRGFWQPVFMCDAGQDATVQWSAWVSGEQIANGWAPYDPGDDPWGTGWHVMPVPIDETRYSGPQLVSVRARVEGTDRIAYSEALVDFAHGLDVPPDPSPTPARLGAPVPRFADRFALSLFYWSPDEAMQDPTLCAAMEGAGLTTYTAPIGNNPGTNTRASYAEYLARKTRGWAEFFAADARRTLILTADDWCRRPSEELPRTLANPEWPTILADTLAHYRALTGNRVLYARVVDEVSLGALYGPDPLAHPPLARVRDAFRAAGVRTTWPAAANVAPEVHAAWAAFGDAYSLNLHTAPGDDFPGRACGLTTAQARQGHDHEARALALMPQAHPWAGLLSGIVTGLRPCVLTTRFGLALTNGASAGEVYTFDSTETQRQRAQYPDDPEMTQLGVHPFGDDRQRAMFRAVAACQQLADALGDRLWHPLEPVPALGPGVRVRQGQGWTLLVNTREVPAKTIPMTFATTGMRWRLVNDTLSSTRCYRGTRTLTLMPGEVTALVEGGA
jgi:hypothetical protein